MDNMEESSNTAHQAPNFADPERSATSTSAFPFFRDSDPQFQLGDQAQPQTTLADDIEIPFARYFSSPMYAQQGDQLVEEGGSDFLGFGGQPWQTLLTAEDVAAFMQIDPADGSLQ